MRLQSGHRLLDAGPYSWRCALCGLIVTDREVEERVLDACDAPPRADDEVKLVISSNAGPALGAQLQKRPELYERTLNDVRWHLATLADHPHGFRWALDCLARVEYVLGIAPEHGALEQRRKAGL